MQPQLRPTAKYNTITDITKTMIQPISIRKVPFPRKTQMPAVQSAKQIEMTWRSLQKTKQTPEQQKTKINSTVAN
jgi:hypothetical protein